MLPHLTEAPNRASKLIRAGDVLVSTVRPDRGAVAATPARLDGAVCSRAFAVLRCTGIDPLALVWLLKTEFVCRQIIGISTGITYPAIKEASCLDLALPVTRENLGDLSGRWRKLRQDSKRHERPYLLIFKRWTGARQRPRRLRGALARRRS